MKPIKTPNNRAVLCGTFDHSGQYLFLGGVGQLFVLNCKEQQFEEPITLPENEAVYACAISPDEPYLALLYLRGLVRIFNIQTGKIEKELYECTSSALSVCISSKFHQSLLSVGTTGNWIWTSSLSTKRFAHHSEIIKDSVQHLVHDPSDPVLWALTASGTIYKIDEKTGNICTKFDLGIIFPTRTDKMTVGIFGDDSRCVNITLKIPNQRGEHSSGSLVTYIAQSVGADTHFTKTREIKLHDTPRGLVLSPQKLVAIGDHNGEVHIFKNLRNTTNISTGLSRLLDFTVSPDQKYLAAWNDKGLVSILPWKMEEIGW